jgi:pyridoxine 5-phosphate synthase
MPRLGVNIDHVATVREARKTNEPDPVWASTLAELGGADGITLHLREDRRHIQERDVRILIETVAVPTNLELAAADEVLAIACEARPTQATLVPERREEVTTEGGLDVAGHLDKVSAAVARLQAAGIVVSLFLDPDPRQLAAGVATGAEAIELHTGAYAHATSKGKATDQIADLTRAAAEIRQAGMILNAGHGLTYRNVRPVAEIAGMHELNIGHSIIARAIMVGLEQAVRDMKRLVE